MDDIRQIIEGLPLSEQVRDNVMGVYQLIAEAESQAHGRPVTEIHFHEVGTMDAIADVTAVCLLMEMLDIKKTVSSPIHVGSGHVHCAHGILPVPAPATAWILHDVPIYGGEINGELCTPTGAALLKRFATSFGAMPVMRVEKIGYGMGKKDFEQANCVRALLGESDDCNDEIIEFACNLDDMTPEHIGYALDRLFDAGALEAYTIPIGMKKSRPGTLMCVICREADRQTILEQIFKHTTTLGVRENRTSRHVLKRRIEQIDSSLGPVRLKIAEGYGVKRSKLEYDDVARIATENNLTLDDVVRAVVKK